MEISIFLWYFILESEAKKYGIWSFTSFFNFFSETSSVSAGLTLFSIMKSLQVYDLCNFISESLVEVYSNFSFKTLMTFPETQLISVVTVFKHDWISLSSKVWHINNCFFTYSNKSSRKEVHTYLLQYTVTNLVSNMFVVKLSVTIEIQKHLELCAEPTA